MNKNIIKELKTWVSVEELNADRITTLRGIVYTYNEHNGFITDKNAFVLNIYHNRPLKESHTMRVYFDDKGVLRLNKKDLAESKEAFIKTCEDMFYEDAEIVTASDVYKHKCWKYIQKWVELHNEHQRDHESTIDVLRNAEKDEWTFKPVPANGKESIKTIIVNHVDKDFLFNDNMIFLRAHLHIKDEARGVVFSGSCFFYANKHTHVQPDDLDLYFALKRVIHVNPAHLRVALLKALDDPGKAYAMSGIFVTDNEIDGLMWDAGKGYQKIVKFFTEQLNS